MSKVTRMRLYLDPMTQCECTVDDDPRGEYIEHSEYLKRIKELEATVLNAVNVAYVHGRNFGHVRKAIEGAFNEYREEADTAISNRSRD